MPTYTRRGNKWRVQVRVLGNQKSASFPTKTEARVWAERVEDEMRRGVSASAGTATLGDVMERFAREISPEREGARWEILRLKRMGRDKVARVRLDRLQPANIADWRDRRLTEVQGSSVRREMNLLRSVLEQCRREWRLIPSNPIDDVRKPKNPKPRDQRISERQVARICLALGFDTQAPEVRTMQHRAALAFLLAIETAMRAGEVLSLTWDQVFLDQRYVHLDKTKNGDTRDVPLSRRAIELIELLEDARQDGDDRMVGLNKSQLDSHFRKGRDATGLKQITFHDSRHEATTRLAGKVKDVLTLARITGHRDPKSLLTYFNPGASEIAEQLD